MRVRVPHRRRQTSAKERERLEEKVVLQRSIKLHYFSLSVAQNAGNDIKEAYI